MAKPQVTITLGRSGQRVVKDAWGDADGSRASVSASSGSKRSLVESFSSSANHAFGSSKRMKDDVSVRSYGYSSHIDDSRLSPKDLRLKLTRKRISRGIELENEERKKIELHEKVSKAIQSVESPDVRRLRSMPSSRMASETPKPGPTRSPYASWISNAAGTRTPERIPISSSGISTPRTGIDELPQIPPIRLINNSRTERVLTSNALDSSRPTVPMLDASRRPLVSGKLVAELPPGTGGALIPPLQSLQVPKESQPLTVSSLLHSLGLGKYYINFQAEEIDMAILKQMGEGDLKELGIPMGPRKKIYLALQARMKRPVTQTQSNLLR